MTGHREWFCYIIMSSFDKGENVQKGCLFNWLMIMVVALLQACSSYQPEPYTCADSLEALDSLLLKNVGTLAASRIEGHPALRTQRFIYSFIEQADASTKQQAAVIEAMHQLALQGLSLEWQNLSPKLQLQWLERYQLNEFAGYTKTCLAQAKQHYLQSRASAAALLAELTAEDDYSTAAKIFGLYPLSSRVFARAVVTEQSHLKQTWLAASQQPYSGFSSQQARLFLPEVKRAVPVGVLQLDSFGRLSDVKQAQRLLHWYAPQWLIERADPNNLPGKPHWQQQQLEVDVSEALSFSKISYGRFKQQTTIQLNYILWFKQRPKLRAFDWVAGQHDALVFRIHLSPELNIIAYDSIHLCGCWYTLMLPEQQAYSAVQQDGQEPVLMHRVKAARNMRVSVSADTHQLVGLVPASRSEDVFEQRYQLQPWQSLLQLPRAKGRSSIFDQHGYVFGSQRLERWFFWPMGVKQPGSLRRFGDHAISFIGERYFDQADLLQALGVQ